MEGNYRIQIQVLEKFKSS